MLHKYATVGWDGELSGVLGPVRLESPIDLRPGNPEEHKEPNTKLGMPLTLFSGIQQGDLETANNNYEKTTNSESSFLGLSGFECVDPTANQVDQGVRKSGSSEDACSKGSVFVAQ